MVCQHPLKVSFATNDPYRGHKDLHLVVKTLLTSCLKHYDQNHLISFTNHLGHSFIQGQKLSVIYDIKWNTRFSFHVKLQSKT